MITQEEKLRRLRQLFGNLIFESDDSTGIATLVTKFSGKRLNETLKMRRYKIILFVFYTPKRLGSSKY